MNNVLHTLPFLEQRNYLQGATLLNFCLENVTNYDSFSFKISTLCKSNTLTITHEYNDKAFAHFNYKIGSEQKYMGLVEAEPVLPLLREGFDESAIIAQCDFLQNKASFSALSSTALVQSFIAANKELLLRNREVKTTGQWLFVCFDCLTPLPIKQHYSLELDAKITPLATSKLYCKNKLLGTIFFRWINNDKH